MSLKPLFERVRPALRLLKWGSLCIIGYLALQLVDFAEIQAGLAALPLPALVLFLCMMLFARVFYALRWKLICASLGLVRIPAGYLLRVGLLSEFVSIVLPSYIGGDGLRLLKLRPYVTGSRAALVSIVADRIMGVLSLAALTAVFLPQLAGFAQLELPVSAMAASGMIFLLIVGLFTCIFFYLERGLARLSIERLKNLSLDAHRLAAALLISVLGHLLYVGGYIVLFHSVTVVEYLPLVAVVLLALLSNSIPLSFLGIEMSDGALIALAAVIGIESQVSLPIVVLVVASRYLFSVIGVFSELLIDGRRFLVEARLTKRSA